MFRQLGLRAGSRHRHVRPDGMSGELHSTKTQGLDPGDHFHREFHSKMCRVRNQHCSYARGQSGSAVCVIRGTLLSDPGLCFPRVCPPSGMYPRPSLRVHFASHSPSFSSRSLLHDVGMVPSCSLPKALRERQSGLGTGAPVSPFRVMGNALWVPCRPHPDVAGRPGGPAEPRLRSGWDLAATSRRQPHAQCAVC